MSELTDLSSVNGFILCDKFIPETALEILLSYVPIGDILKLRQVCQLWKEIVCRRSFWKEVYDRNGLNWKGVPNYVKEKEEAWMVLFCSVKHRVWTKNFVKNHSGHEQFSHWEKLQDGGDRITVESPAAGVSPLPADPRFEGEADSAFVTSYGWSAIRQKINLREEGLTPEILRTMIPFQFVLTNMVGIRFDCGGMYCLCLCLLDDHGKAVAHSICDSVHQAGEDWIQATCTLNVLELRQLDRVRHLGVIICGKDNQFWAGHFGPKFSRISVTTRYLDPEEVTNLPVNQLSARNPEVARELFFRYGSNFWNEMFPRQNQNRRSDHAEDWNESESEDDAPQPERRVVNCNPF